MVKCNVLFREHIQVTGFVIFALKCVYLLYIFAMYVYFIAVLTTQTTMFRVLKKYVFIGSMALNLCKTGFYYDRKYTKVIPL